MKVELEQKDWEDMKAKAVEMIRRDDINSRINKLILELCEKEIRKYGA